MSEILTWHKVTERLRGDDSAVLYEAPGDDEPIWLSWHQDGQWFEIGSSEIECVVRWAEMPRGGLA